MTTSHLVSPPYTPNEPAVVQKRLGKRKGYRKIRFKAWAPANDDCDDITEPASCRQQAAANSNSTTKATLSTASQTSDACLTAQNIKSIYQCPSPLTKLPDNGTRQDPFVSLPINATGCVPATLDYFIKVVSPEQDSCLLGANPLEPHMTLLFPFMLQSAPLFQSIIALCRGSILVSLGRAPMDDKAVMYHRSKALTAVTECLSTDSCSSDAVLLTIAMLLTLEYMAGNAAGVSAHIAGLNKLVALRSDLDESTPWKSFVIRGLAAFKALGSFITGQPPDIPKDSQGFIEEAFAELSLDEPLNYPCLPFDPDLCTILARLPSGFSELCLSGHISVQGMHVLACLSATTKYCETDIFDDCKLDSELQAMLSVLQRLSLLKVTIMERYLTCALVAWSFQLRKLRPLNLFHDPPLRTFIKLVSTQEKPDSIREQNCLIWISIAVAGALNLRSIRMPGTHLVLDRLFTLYPVSRDWRKLAPILKSFYWTDRIGAHWKKCWDKGIERWQIVQNREFSRGVFCCELAEIEENPPFEEPDEATIADIAAHTRAAPRSWMEASQAARCPFLQRKTQKQAGT